MYKKTNRKESKRNILQTQNRIKVYIDLESGFYSTKISFLMLLRDLDWDLFHTSYLGMNVANISKQY